jgi:hypothetical protein
MESKKKMIVSTKIARMFKHPGFVNIDYLVENKLEKNTSKILNILNRDWRKWVKPLCMRDCGDPTFGYTSIGGNTPGLDGAKAATQHIAPESGTITEVCAYFYADDTPTHGTAVYGDSGSDTPNALLAAVTRADIPLDTYNWYHFTGYSLAITSGVKYWLTFHANSYCLVKFDVAAYKSRVQTAGADYLPSDNPFGAGTDYSDRVYSIYAAYTTLVKPKGTIAMHAKLAGVI